MYIRHFYEHGTTTVWPLYGKFSQSRSPQTVELKRAGAGGYGLIFPQLLFGELRGEAQMALQVVAGPVVWLLVSHSYEQVWRSLWRPRACRGSSRHSPNSFSTITFVPFRHLHSYDNWLLTNCVVVDGPLTLLFRGEGVHFHRRLNSALESREELSGGLWSWAEPGMWSGVIRSVFHAYSITFSTAHLPPICRPRPVCLAPPISMHNRSLTYGYTVCAGWVWL